MGYFKLIAVIKRAQGLAVALRRVGRRSGRGRAAMRRAVVEYRGWKEGYRCGYCASAQGKVSAGERGDAGRGRCREPRRCESAAALTKDGGARRSVWGSAVKMAGLVLPVGSARAVPAAKMAGAAASGRRGARCEAAGGGELL